MHHVFGLDVGRGFTFDNKNPNPRLSRVAGDYKRLINNMVEDQGKRNRFTKLLEQFSEINGHDRGSVHESHALLPPDIRLRIIHANEKTNRIISKKYLERKDGQLFLDPLPDPNEHWPGNDLSQNEAVFISQYIFAKEPQLVQWLSQELEKHLDTDSEPQRGAARFLAAALSRAP